MQVYYNLMEAVHNHELDQFLLGHPKYKYIDGRTFQNFNVSNDYEGIVRSLNKYGASHPDFINQLRATIKQLLTEKSADAAMAISMIANRQLVMEYFQENKIEFLDDEILLLLSEAVYSNKLTLMNDRQFEAEGETDGMFGVIKGMSNGVFRLTGKKLI